MRVYQVKIQLVASKPVVWRRVLIPADFTFKLLHEIIQLSMGWLDQHHYEYFIEDENISITDNGESYKQHSSKKKEGDGELIINKKSSIKIGDYLEEYIGIDYCYDIIDFWHHKIKLERIIDDYELEYPKIIEGLGNCPPEGVGGAEGYKKFLDIWNNPSHPDYKELCTWANDRYYNEFDIDERNDLLKAFAYRIY